MITEILADKIFTIRTCPRRYSYKYIHERESLHPIWKLRTEAVREVLDIMIKKSNGDIPTFLDFTEEQFITECWKSLAYIQLRHSINIPKGTLVAFLETFKKFWITLRKAILPYKGACLYPSREFKVEIPDLSSFGIKNKYTMRAIADFSIVSSDVTILGVLSLKQQSFKDPQKMVLKLLTYLYFLTVGESPSYVGMLFSNSGKFKFLETHLYKEKFIKMYKQYIWEFVKMVDGGVFPPMIGKACKNCSYSIGCIEYIKTIKEKKMNFVTKVPLTELI